MIVKCNKTTSIFKKDHLYIIRASKEHTEAREYAKETVIIMTNETFKKEFCLFFDLVQSPIKTLEKCLSL